MRDEHAPASLDAQFDALCHVERRRLLSAVLEAKTDDDLPVTIDELKQNDAAQSFEAAMIHVHIPNLEEKGLIEVSDDDHAVTPGPRFHEIRPLLELVSSNRERLAGDWV